MKHVSFKGTGIAAALVTLSVLCAIALQTPIAPKPKAEKICPITFGLYPGTLLEKHYAAKIEEDNGVLSAFMSQLRSSEGLLPWAKKWADGAVSIDKTDSSKVSATVKEFLKILDDKDLANPFEGTYLEEPSLTKENGETVTGVPAVVHELIRIVEGSTYVDAQSVQVYLQYLPSNSTEYADINRAHPDTHRKGPIDIIAHIHTVLAYAPYDDPVRISGTQGHRTICDPGY